MLRVTPLGRIAAGMANFIFVQLTESAATAEPWRGQGRPRLGFTTRRIWWLWIRQDSHNRPEWCSWLATRDELLRRQRQFRRRLRARETRRRREGMRGGREPREHRWWLRDRGGYGEEVRASAFSGKVKEGS